MPHFVLATNERLFLATSNPFIFFTISLFLLIFTWFESKTMHRMGRDGLQILNIRNYDVQEGDVAVFLFGEVDARCHIGKQRDVKNRELFEVIDTLVRNYMRTLIANKALLQKTYFVIVSVVPPSNNCFNPTYPYYGTIEDRAHITKLLNAQLKESCMENAFTFLDIHSLYANENNTLDEDKSDHVVHVNPRYNDQIKNLLLDILKKNYDLF